MFGKIFNIKAYNFKYYHVLELLIAFSLSFIGLTVIEVLQDPKDRLYERQIFGLAVGIAVALLVSMVDYHFICKLYPLLYLANVAMLLAVKFVGSSYRDAQRWIDIPKIGRVQPSELSKVLLILFLAALMDRFRKKIDKLYFLLLVCILAAVPIYLILEQPDLSTAIALLLVLATMIYLSGVSYKIVLPVLIIAIPLCAALWWYIQQDFQFLLHPYQQNRILALKNPELYPELMWQQENAAKAIKAGGLAGKFITQGAVKENMLCHILPAIESDFIFTAIGEAYGFIGGCLVIGLIAFFVTQAFRTAFRASDYLGMLIAGGIGSMIAVQTVINVCVNTSLFPNTGIPLPFTSSGLSSLIGNYAMIGVLMNVGLQSKEKKRQEPL